MMMPIEHIQGIPKDAIKKILIVNLGGIGDALLSTPALRAIVECYPSATLSMLVVPRVAAFVKTLPYIDRVHTFRFRGARSLFSNFYTLLTLRNEKFDLSVNMRTIVSTKSAQRIKKLFDIINPRITAGRNTDGRGGFFTISVPETRIGEKFDMEYDIDLALALGAYIKDKQLQIRLEPNSLEKINHIFHRHHFAQNDIIIGIHPGGSPSRRWPIENFAKIIKNISAKLPHTKFVITGDSTEKELGNYLMRLNSDTVHNLMGALSIPEVCALIKKTTLFIVNDTGIMHIAAVLQRPLVAIFGPGQLTRFDPRVITDKAVVLYKKIECAPCDFPVCDRLACLKCIEPGEVTDAALDLLKKYAH